LVEENIIPFLRTNIKPFFSQSKIPSILILDEGEFFLFNFNTQIFFQIWKFYFIFDRNIINKIYKLIELQNMQRLLRKIALWLIIALTSNKFKSVLMCCDPLIPITNFNASKVNKIFKIIITTLILKALF